MPAPSLTRIGTTPSLGPDSSPMRPTLQARPCASGQHGRSAGTTGGGPCLERSEARRGKRPGSLVHDDLVARGFSTSDINEL